MSLGGQDARAMVLRALSWEPWLWVPRSLARPSQLAACVPHSANFPQHNSQSLRTCGLQPGPCERTLGTLQACLPFGTPQHTTGQRVITLNGPRGREGGEGR